MVDWGMSGRVDSYSFVGVNPFTLQETGKAFDVIDGSSNLTWGYYTDNVLSGSLKTVDDIGRNQLVRVKHSIQLPDGNSYSHTLGTMFIEDTGESALYGNVEHNVDCYSTLWRFTQDTLCQDFFRPKGYNVVQEIKELVESDGGKLLVGAGVDTSKVHTRDIFFEFNTNRAKVLNTIAGWIDCIVSVNPDGYITLEPYMAPQHKPVGYTFEAGRNCVYLAGLDIEENTDSLANRVVVYYSTQEKSESVWVDLDAGDTFSYENIGRRVSHVIQLDSETPRDKMIEIGKQWLRDNNTTIKYFEIQHAYIPNVEVGSVVRYINETDYRVPINEKCLITQIDMKLDKAGMCKTKLKVVR